MDKEKQRIAIAKACGIDPVLANNMKCPNYPEDLNACHEMVNILSDTDKVFFANYLYEISRSNHDDKDVSFITATAPQRCEAFLKTLGLWKKR